MAYYTRPRPSTFSSSPAPASEPCTKWTYDVQKEAWSSEPVQVRFHPGCLGEGGMRRCYRMDEVYPDGSTSPYVAKFFKPELRAREEDLFNEAVVQYVADTFAQDFNRKPTSRKVAFLACYILRRTSQPGQPLCFAEPYLEGRFDKHNNNYGGNFTRDPTPAAFSHFTYESSNHLLLVCDIQGVGDFYTDPQIHSYDGQGFGFGNMGRRGIDRFLATHRCNDVCRAVGLPAIQPPAAPQGLGHTGAVPMGFMGPMDFPQLGGLSGAGHHPLAAIMQMLQRMPMAQGDYAGPIHNIGTVLGRGRGLPAPSGPGPAPHGDLPNALLIQQQQQQQQQREREERDLQRAVALSLHDAHERDVQRALTESLRLADEAQLTRAMSESAALAAASRPAPPLSRATSEPLQEPQGGGVRHGIRRLIHHS